MSFGTADFYNNTGTVYADWQTAVTDTSSLNMNSSCFLMHSCLLWQIQLLNIIGWKDEQIEDCMIYSVLLSGGCAVLFCASVSVIGLIFLPLFYEGTFYWLGLKKKLLLFTQFKSRFIRHGSARLAAIVFPVLLFPVLINNICSFVGERKLSSANAYVLPENESQTNRHSWVCYTEFLYEYMCELNTNK